MRTRIYQDYYIKHQLSHRPAADISWIGSMQTFFLFAAALVGGPLLDQYGGRVCIQNTLITLQKTDSCGFLQFIWAPSIVLVFSVMATSVCGKYYQFSLAQGVLGGAGMGMSMALALASTAQYFHEKPAVAIGITVAGSSIGGVVFPVALEQMLYSSLGFACAVGVVGFILLGVHGLAIVSIRPYFPPRKRQSPESDVVKEPGYIATIGVIVILYLGIFTPFFHLPLYGHYHCMSTRMSFYLISILNGNPLFGRLVPGILAEQIGTLNMLSTSSCAAGILTISWIRMATNAPLILFAVLYGFSSGGIISLTAAAIASIPKSPREIGTYMGIGMGVLSIASLVGPPINGVLAHAYTGLLQVQIFSGLVMLAGAILVVFTKLVSRGLFSKD
jgi:MFS family permease